MAGLRLAVALVAAAGSAWCMAWAVRTDVACRRIPRASCYGLALSGAAFQGALFGMGAVAEGACFGAAAVAVCLAASWLAARVPRCGRGGSAAGRGRHGAARASPGPQRPSRERPLGAGDVRLVAALSVATGAQAAAGALASSLVAALVCGTAVASGRAKWGDTVPYAPFLAVWLAVGLAAALL